MNRLVVVSNRVPLPSSGPQTGGLAVALDGMMEQRGGVWFGWSGQVAADAESRSLRVEQVDEVEYDTFDLTPEEHTGYYNQFSNSVLWPLFHTLPELMQYDRHDARTYRAVNERVAGLLEPKLRPGDLVWIHDYHLLPFAAALRGRGVRNPIGFFLHIPFAQADVLAAAPEMNSLVRDMLAADLLGFQTDNDLRNFIAAAETMCGATRLDETTLRHDGRRVSLGAFPVEIDPTAFATTAAAAVRTVSTERLRRSVQGQSLILGLDRLDPTKGLPQRLAGVRALFENHPDWRRRATVLQIAATSRKDVESYRSLRIAIDRAAGALNADLGDADWSPLRLITRAVSREVGAGYMRAARVGLVTPLRDGMNLVAKEFVAAQDPHDPGVLVLSRFAGAARQLDAALLVNPHDSEAMGDALNGALHMPLAERQQRWRSLWAAIDGRTPLTWGRSFVDRLVDVAAYVEHEPSIDIAIVPVQPSGPAFTVGEPLTTERLALRAAQSGEKPAVRRRLN